MGTGDTGRAVERLYGGFSLAVLQGEKRVFRLGFACAVVLHVLLILLLVGFGHSAKRRVGEASGSLDGISVVLVDEADFRSMNSVPLEGRQPTPTGAPARSPAEQSDSQPAAAAKPQKQSATALARQEPELLNLPDDLARQPPEPAPSKRPVEPQRPKQQRQEPSPKRDKAEPPVFTGDKFASFARPAGITRSGENDDFARGVIRALRQTMPPGRGSRGRVTIRFLLSTTGNLVDVQVVATTGDGELTQNVVFASKQSNFPIPPTNSTVPDRTFLVTYIYQ
jgi:TonB family protein